MKSKTTNHTKYIKMIFPYDYDHVKLLWEYENDDRNFLDHSLSYPGKNPRGKDHFPTWKQIKRQRIFRGTDH